MQIDSPELVLNAILLCVNNNTRATTEILNKFVAASREHTEKAVSENETAKLYIRILTELLKNKATKENKDQLRIILLRFKDDPRFKSDPTSFQLIYDTLLSDEVLTQEKISELRIVLANALAWSVINDKYKQGFGLLYKASGVVDPLAQEKAISDIITMTADIKTATDKVTDNRGIEIFPGLIQSINFSKPEDLSEAIKTNDTVVVRGGFTLGLKGVSRLFGRQKGPVRGESIVINARSHNYKSYMLMSMTRWIAQYNRPPEVAPGKMPLIWFTSLENEAWRDTVWIIRQMYSIEYNKPADDVPEEELVAYIGTKFKQFGWELIIDRFLPETFGYAEYVKRYENLEAAGYEVVVSVVDYMNNMRKDQSLSRDIQVRQLYSNMCNFTKSRKTTLITAHQLNRLADTLKLSGVSNVVRKFGPAQLSDSTDVQREVDFAMFMEIERVGGVAYLTMSRENGKHRYVDDTPIAHQYTAYKFGPLGILDDINGDDQSVADIYMITPDEMAEDESMDMAAY